MSDNAVNPLAMQLSSRLITTDAEETKEVTWSWRHRMLFLSGIYMIATRFIHNTLAYSLSKMYPQFWQ
jgi:hypothetical protein